jgi:hypothetical protein
MRTSLRFIAGCLCLIWIALTPLHAQTPRIATGSVDPEGVVRANKGSLYLCTACGEGGTGALFVKTSGTGTTGWTEIAPVEGALTVTSVNKVTITAPATSATLTIPNGVTLNAGAGGTLGSNAFTSTAYLPTAGGTITGDVTPQGRLMVPMGEVAYFNTTGTSVTIGSQSNGATNMVVVAPTSTLTNDMEFDNGGADTGRMRYTGATTKVFHVAVTLSGTPTQPNDVFVFGIAKNGTVDPDCRVLGSASGTQFSALHCMVTLATNQYLEAYVGNTSAGRNITIKSLNLFAMGM